MVVCRICLERLGVVEESDHKALVIRVFWRYVTVVYPPLCVAQIFVSKIYPDHANIAVDVLARTRGLAWGMGLG